MALLRLDRMLSGQSVHSRGEIRKMISSGAVTVNGRRAANPAVKIDTAKDAVLVNGKEIKYREHIYIMMNKPAGVISASNDRRAKTVLNLLPQALLRPGLFPAGRLDRDTEGFMLITDDGNFAHDILSPKRHVYKKYYAVIDSPLSPEDVARFENGLEISGGDICKPARVSMMESGASSGGAKTIVTICEGKFHQIKRMFAALGHSVIYLKRISIGGLELDKNLGPGDAREITSDELALVKGTDMGL